MNLNKNELNEETFNQISKQIPTKERNNICQLDNYCLFISSKYFETIQDHINLIQISKRMKLNMEKFHYNPISLTKKIVSFFPNVETQHIYKPKDEYFTTGRIQRYVDWNPTAIWESKEKKEENEIEFKQVV